MQRKYNLRFVYIYLLTAQSTPFQLMFQSNKATDVTVSSLKLNLGTNPALLMLTFLHTGNIPDATFNDLPGLFEAAKRFEVAALTEACRNTLVDLADVKDEKIMLIIQALELEYGSNRRLEGLLRDYHCDYTDWDFDENDYVEPDNRDGKTRKAHKDYN